MATKRTFKQKLKLILRRFHPWAYKAWEWIHNKRQFSKTMRVIDYHLTSLFNRKLAREIKEMTDKMVYEDRMARTRYGVSTITVEEFKRDYEKMMPELLLTVMQRLYKLESELDNRINIIVEKAIELHKGL